MRKLRAKSYLEVAVNNALLVTVLNSMDDLPEFVPSVRFSQSTIPSDEVCTATLIDFTTQHTRLFLLAIFQVRLI